MRDHGVESSSSPESSDTDSDSDSDSVPSDRETPVRIDPYLIYLKKVAQKLDHTPEDHATFTKFVAKFPIVNRKAAKRRAEETLADLASRRQRPKTQWLCLKCDKPFTVKDDLKKHQKACKKRSNVEDITNTQKTFPCDKCDKSYVNKANLKRHVNSKHGSAASEVTQSKKYKCVLCADVLVGIYKHYGTKHDIANTEDLLLDNGRVLVNSNKNTEYGNAPWFKEQLEKAKNRYDNGDVCRLCDVNIGRTLLQGHYTSYHNVHADSLGIITHIFRADKTAHLGETSNPRRADKKVNVTDKKKVEIRREPQENNIAIIYKCKCGKITDDYDGAVEHSQEHLLEKSAGKGMSINRSSSIETDNNDRVTKEINYDFETLLTEAWFQIFNEITLYKERILSSSLYKYSRCVKFHSEDADSATGIPAYKCVMCQLFVDPTKIENHCKNFNICVKNKPDGHYCKDCDVHFYSASALAYHKENHAAGFRLVTFNHRNDATSNNTLRMLQNRSDDSQENVIIEETPKSHADGKPQNPQIHVAQYCGLCDKWMEIPVFEAHKAEHHKEKETSSGISNESSKDPNNTEHLDVGNHSGSAARQESEQQPQDNRVDDGMHVEDHDPTNDGNSKETAITGEIGHASNDTESVTENESAIKVTEQPQDNRTDVMQAEGGHVTMDDDYGEENHEDSVESWDSEDSYPGIYIHTSISVQADIHMCTNINITAVENDNQPTMSGDESLPCTQELYQIFGSGAENGHEEQRDTTNDDILPTTQELMLILSDDDARDEKLEEQNRQKASRDISSEDAIRDQNGESVEANMADNGGGCNEPQDATAQGDVCDDEAHRTSASPDDDAEFDKDDFLKLCERVSMTLSSRDR